MSRRVLITDLKKASDIRKTRLKNAPYYNQRTAIELIPILDYLILNPKKAARWNYADFPSLTADVLKLRLYSGWNYAIDYCDPEGKYMELRKSTVLTSDATGVMTKRIGTLTSCVMYVDDEEAASTDLHWREELTNFLEDATKKTFKKGGLNLSREDQLFIQHCVTENENLTGDKFYTIVRPGDIKILRREPGAGETQEMNVKQD
jgi:hypothetical protein